MNASTRIPLKRTGEGRFVDRFTLDSSQATAKKVTLSNLPKDTNGVVVDLPCGTVQVLGDDYDVIGLEVDWNGKGLETILEAGDKIIITYS